MILPSKGMQGVSGCLVFDAANDAGSAAGKPWGSLEARLNFAWISVQDSGQKSKTGQESARCSGSFRLLYRRDNPGELRR
jgi:hypothetical protein